eukprot:g29482.t1
MASGSEPRHRYDLRCRSCEEDLKKVIKEPFVPLELISALVHRAQEWDLRGASEERPAKQSGRLQEAALASEAEQQAKDDLRQVEELVSKKSTVRKIAGTFKRLKRAVLENVVPFFRENEEEQWTLVWSPEIQNPRHQKLKKSRSRGRPSSHGVRNKLQRAVMRARAIFLRFGISIQRGSVVRAYEEFHSLWLEEFEQNRVPGVGTLCALVIAHRQLPNKGDVTEAWASEAEKVLKDAAKEWVLPAHEFTDAVHRLGSLPVEKVLKLINMVDEALLAMRYLKDGDPGDALETLLKAAAHRSLPVEKALKLISMVDEALAMRYLKDEHRDTHVATLVAE